MRAFSPFNFAANSLIDCSLLEWSGDKNRFLEVWPSCRGKKALDEYFRVEHGEILDAFAGADETNRNA